MEKEQEQKINNMPLMYIFSSQEDVLPTFKENLRKNWIDYGDDNLYPDDLVDLMNGSTKHASLLNKKVRMSAGKGFEETDANKLFLDNASGSDNLNTIAYKTAFDLMLYGGYCLAVTWSKDKKSIARVTYIDYKSVRRARTLYDDSDMAKRQKDGVEFFYTSPDWSKYKKDNYKPELFQGFSEQYKDIATQLIYVQEYRPGTDFYTLPDYISGLRYIKMDYKIAEYNLDSIDSGLTPNLIISFRNGVPSPEEMKAFDRQLNKQYAGAKGKKIFTTFTDSKDTAPEFVPIDIPDASKRFAQLEEAIQNNIIVAHEASYVVAGIPVQGKLGTSSEITEAEDAFASNIIIPKQEILLRGFNKIARINKIDDLVLIGIRSFNKNTTPNAN